MDFVNQQKGLHSYQKSQSVLRPLPGGQKTYMNNLPIIGPKTTRYTFSKQRSTTKSRNRDPNVQWKSVSKRQPDASNAAESESDNGDELAVLKA